MTEVLILGDAFLNRIDWSEMDDVPCRFWINADEDDLVNICPDCITYAKTRLLNRYQWLNKAAQSPSVPSRYVERTIGTCV